MSTVCGHHVNIAGGKRRNMKTLFKNAEKVIVGNGDVIEKGSLLAEGKKILGVGRDVSAEDAEVVDAPVKSSCPA